MPWTMYEYDEIWRFAYMIDQGPGYAVQQPQSTCSLDSWRTDIERPSKDRCGNADIARGRQGQYATAGWIIHSKSSKQEESKRIKSRLRNTLGRL